MTKVETAKVLNISRPTLDLYLKDNSDERNYLLFIMSFSLWEFNDRIARIKESEKEEE